MALEDGYGGLVGELVPVRGASTVVQIQQRLLLQSRFEQSAAHDAAGHALGDGSAVLFAPVLVFIPVDAALGEQFAVAHGLGGEGLAHVLAVADGGDLHAQVVVLQVLEAHRVEQSLLVPMPGEDHEVVPVILQEEHAGARLVLDRVLHEAGLEQVGVEPSRRGRGGGEAGRSIP